MFIYKLNNQALVTMQTFKSTKYNDTITPILEIFAQTTYQFTIPGI